VNQRGNFCNPNTAPKRRIGSLGKEKTRTRVKEKKKREGHTFEVPKKWAIRKIPIDNIRKEKRTLIGGQLASLQYKRGQKFPKRPGGETSEGGEKKSYRG